MNKSIVLFLVNTQNNADLTDVSDAHSLSMIESTNEYEGENVAFALDARRNITPS